MEIDGNTLRGILDEERLRKAREADAERSNREMRRRWERRRRLRAAGDFLGALAFLAVVVAVVALCCAVSGYHWE